MSRTIEFNTLVNSYQSWYGQLFRMLLSEENGVLRYGARFYEEFYKNSDDLLNALIKPE